MSQNDAAHPPHQSGAKKLRFDDEVTTSAATPDVAASSCVPCGRSALKGSPNISSSPLFASSLRRSSEAASSHGDVHVQLNPNPEVIQHDGSVTTLADVALTEGTPLPTVAAPAGEVANFLADVGAGLNNGFSISSFSAPSVPAMSVGSPNGSTAVVGYASSTSDTAACSSAAPDASDRFRTLLLQLSALILEHRPKDPEQYIVDHLNARLLTASAIHRAPRNEMDGEAAAPASGDGEAPHDGRGDDDDSGATASRLATDTTSSVFRPFGDTVVERLASNALSTEVSHAVLARIAKQLISAQPDDPEDFLWARLEARSFGEEAAHNVMVNAEGYPVVRPEDPAQLALLKDIPPSSPGYVIAVNLLPALFAKKPADPISYLFYHIGNRARSSAAPSVHSSTRHLRGNVDEEDDFEAESCTSREFGEDSYSGPEDGVEAGSVSESANQLPLQRKGSLGSLFDAAAAAAGTNGAGQPARRSAGGRHRPSTHGLTSSRASSGRRSVNPATAAPTTRVAKDAAAASAQDELAALYNSSAKRVSIAQQEVQPPSPSHFSYDSAALPSGNVGNSSLAGPTRSNRDSASTVEPHAWNGPPLAATGAPHGSSGGSALWRMEADEHARIHQDFALLRVREELRLERLQHEIRTLARECEYRTRMAVLNKTDRMADRAAATAREALEEAHVYRGFLCAQLDQLEGEQQRQMRLVSQQVARMASPGFAGGVALSAPSAAAWLNEDAAYRQADPCGPATSSYGIPSELDILKKQVELLTMEQARAKYCGYASVAPSRYRGPTMPTSQPNCRSPHPMQ